MTEYDLETRQRIFDLIKEEPGLHFREMERRLEMATGLLEYHLHYLEGKEVVVAKEDRYYKRYYPTNLDARDKRLLSSIRQKNPRRIVLFLLLNSSATHKAIMERLSFKPSTLSLYLEDLVKKKTLIKEKRGRENMYCIAEPDRAERVLLAYKRSLLDEIVDSFLETWLEDVYR
ncbi:MAG: transcriptional regulator [Thermoplasmata archaeon]|nr:transcriptional regulator [Thermoplasmata archaeon]